jgi:hypothetical protein
MLPNLVIIGAMKAGTTSLHHYLDLHPEVAMAPGKELDFFVAEHNWKKGLGWYEARFPQRAPVLGESSPNYSKFPVFDGVAERMHAVLPDARLLYVVRDPLERIVSHHLHNTLEGRERRTLAEALGDPERSPYVQCSRYFMQIEQYLRFYHQRDLCIVSSERLKSERRATLRRIFRFLGVDEGFFCPAYASELNRSSERRAKRPLVRTLARSALARRLEPVLPAPVVRGLRAALGRVVEPPPLDTELRARLLESLGPDAERLRAFCGDRFEEWRC